MQKELNVVGIQADLVWENPIQNIAFIEEEINKLSKNTDLVILPEMFTTGFTMKPENITEKMDGISVTWMKRMAKKKDVAIVGSLVIKESNKYFNRLIFVHPSGKVETYNKRHSFTLAGEDKVYTSGNEKLIVEYKGWKICPLICYDLRFPVWARNTENYDVLLYVANWPKPRISAWNTLLKARAIENMSYCVGVNRVGIDANNYEYTGNSVILDCLGTELTDKCEFKEQLLIATLDKDSILDTRKKLGFLNDKDSFLIQ